MKMMDNMVVSFAVAHYVSGCLNRVLCGRDPIIYRRSVGASYFGLYVRCRGDAVAMSLFPELFSWRLSRRRSYIQESATTHVSQLLSVQRSEGL